MYFGIKTQQKITKNVKIQKWKWQEKWEKKNVQALGLASIQDACEDSVIFFP